MFQQLRIFPVVLLILLAVTLLEKLIFALYHSSQFNELAFTETLQALASGLKFDLAITAALGLIAYLIAYLGSRLLRLKFLAILRYSTFFAITVLVILHGADMLYYAEAGRHLGYELKESFNSGAALAVAALSSYVVPVALQLVLLLPLYLFNSKLFTLWQTWGSVNRTGNPLRWFEPELSLLAALFLTIILVRGGFSSVPLEPLHAQEIGDSRQASLALNGAYNAVFSSVTPYAIHSAFSAPLSGSEVTLVRNLYQRQKQETPGGEFKPHNVIIIFLESWSGAYMASYGYETQTTPFFDQLREKSLTTRGMLAGGHRTTEGMFATACPEYLRSAAITQPFFRAL
jgi:glucan phosphoethanolaminetransferase (alkaline phosphatase superfamily)